MRGPDSRYRRAGLALLTLPGGFLATTHALAQDIGPGNLGPQTVSSGSRTVVGDTNIIGAGTAITVNGSGSLVFDASTGPIVLQSSNASAGGLLVGTTGTVTGSGPLIRTSGTAASAIQVNSGSLTLSNATVATTGLSQGATIGAYGAFANGVNSVVTLNNSLITTTGPAAAAVSAIDGRIFVNNSTLETAGPAGPGGSTGAYGVSVQGANGRGEAVGTSITTTGGGSGMVVFTGSTGSGTGLNIRILGAGNTSGYGFNVQGGTATLGGSTIFTETVTGIGIRASAASGPTTITASDTNVTTTGASGAGVLASAEFGRIDATRLTVDTSGATAYGLSARSLAIINGTDLAITTTGAEAIGAHAYAGGQVSLLRGFVTTQGAGAAQGLNATGAGSLLVATDVPVRTAGADAFGAGAEEGGAIRTLRGSIQTTGPGAHGAMASGPDSTVLLVGTPISTTGVGAHGAAVFGGGNVTGSNLTVSATGGAASALFLSGPPGTLSSAAFTGASLSSVAAPAIAVAGGGAQVTLTNTTVTGNGTWLRVGTADAFADAARRGLLPTSTLTASAPVSGNSEEAEPAPPLRTSFLRAGSDPGVASVIASNAMLTGAALTDPGSISNVSLLNGTVWNMTGSSNLTNLVNNASTINFAPQSGGNFLTLTAGSYAGGAGTLGMNTFLGADNSPSDRLVISGGTATGSTSILISNAGGPGAYTTGNGILVVDAINGGTTQPGAFSLGRPVIAGPYEYTLFRSSRDGANAQAWYLRNTLPPQPPEPPPVPPDPNPGPSPQPAPTPSPIPNYRQEISLYAALPSMVQALGLAMIDNLHDRVGEEEHMRGRSDLGGRNTANGGWVRIFGQHAARNGGGIFRDGPAFQQDMAGFQAGFDVFRREYAGHRDHVGVYAAAAAATGTVDHVITGARAGRVQINGYSLGGYWTHFGPSGWYVDAIAQIGTYDVKATSSRLGLSHSGDTTSYVASLEAGYPLAIRGGRLRAVSPGGPGWVLEPQAQIVWQRFTSADGGDAAARIRYDDTDSLVGRFSLRLAHTWLNGQPTDPRRITAWARAGVFHEFLGDSRMYVSSADGPIGFRSNLGGTWAGFNLGVSAQVGTNTSLYANANYQTDFSGDRHSYGGRAGIRINW